ncbi:MAG: pimeloyl-ACP methyl ester carboxylesterase [Pseudohongiellaceae bacterium]|jgi:pimeloyl-ACP methyl ester carboxylesterase
MKIFIVTLLLSFLPYGLVSAASSDRHVASKVKRENGSFIHYYLEYSPDKLRADTLLVAFQGSDCNSIKHSNFTRDFSKVLWHSADLLLIEKPGLTSSLSHDSSAERPDCPDYYLNNDSPAQRVQDANAVVIQVLKGGSYRKVIAMGGSEGATVAAMFAAESGIPDAVVFINGGGRWFLDDVLHNIKSTTSEHQMESELEGFKGFAEHVLETDPFDIEMSNHGYTWWRSVLTIDQKSVLNQIKVPTLVVQGGRDKSVSPKALIEMIEDLRKEGKSNIELIIYPEMDHGLSARNGRQMAKEVSEDIASWLKTSLLPSPNNTNTAAR